MLKKVKNISCESISSKYYVRRLNSKDIDSVLALCSKNSLYYQYCPPFITRNGVMEDMEALPPGKNQDDKYFLGYYENDSLIAIMDLIVEYPNIHTAYMGLFMVDTTVQGKGVGTAIIEELCNYLSKTEFQRVELAWVKGNPQSERFWIKNKFKPFDERSGNVAEHLIVAERFL